MKHLDIQHVPYRGAAPVITDLLAGRLTLYFGAVAPLIPLVKAGKVRALAVTSAKRFAATPDLPTMIEAGYPGFVSVLSIGLMAPAGTPPAIVEQIHQASVKALSTPGVRGKLDAIGMEVVNNSPKEFAAAIDGGTPAMGENHQGGGNNAGQLAFGARLAAAFGQILDADLALRKKTALAAARAAHREFLGQGRQPIEMDRRAAFAAGDDAALVDGFLAGRQMKRGHAPDVAEIRSPIVKDGGEILRIPGRGDSIARYRSAIMGIPAWPASARQLG